MSEVVGGQQYANVTVDAATSPRTLRALVDSGSQLNLIDKTLAQDLAWKGKPCSYTASVCGGMTLPLTNMYEQKVTVTDSAKQSRDFVLTFVEHDDPGFPLMLGSPWLEQVGVDYHNWRTKVWRYASPPQIETISVEEASREIEHGAIAYVGVLHFEEALKAGAVAATPGTDDFAEDGQPSWEHWKPGPPLGANADDVVPLKDRVPHRYREYLDVFSRERAAHLPQLGETTVHAIDTTAPPPFGPLYNLSAFQLAELRKYLDEALDKGWIQHSMSPAGAPILFIPKKDGRLRLCVDYRGLNKVTKKNRYALPLINEALDRLAGAMFFTKIDLKDAYHRIRIRPGDEWKTAFRTRYGHFEYKVMPFGLTNAPGTFQAYVNNALAGLLDDICIVYLDDIIIYSVDEKAHEQDVLRVLERLRQHGLYANVDKCTFHAKEINFVGFIIGRQGVRTEPARVRAITEWPVPKSIRDIRQFLGFVNFYRRFIHRFSRVAGPLYDMLTGNVQGPAELTTAAMEAFNELKSKMTTAPVLRHFNEAAPIRIETDASGKAIAGTLSQPDLEEGVDTTSRHYHPVAFYSRKMQGAELRYGTYDQELMAIVDSFKEWRHYLEGAHYVIEVLTDHNNLRYFATTKELNPRQARWTMLLAGYDFEIKHRPGSTNPADGPSRRPDYMEVEIPGTQYLLPTIQDRLRSRATRVLYDRAARARRGRVQTLCISIIDNLIGSIGPRPREPVSRGLFTALTESIGSMASDKGLSGVAPQGQPSLSQGHAATAPLSQSSGSMATRGMRAARLERERHKELVSEGAPTDSVFSHSRSDLSSWLELLERPRRAHALQDEQSSRGAMVARSQVEAYLDRQVPRVAIRALVGSGSPYHGESEELRDQISSLQEGDAFCVAQRSTALSESSDQLWSVTPNGPHGLLCRRGKIVIPDVAALRRELLRIHHDDPLSGHFGHRRTLELLSRHYYWKSMQEDVKNYVDTCTSCQLTKSRRHRPYGELQPLPVPEGPWQEIAMDFVTGLPPSEFRDKLYDAILVIICRYSKQALYLATTKDLTAEGLADLLLNDVFLKGYGFPTGIVTDRGSLFTSDYWSNVCYQAKIVRKLSTAFHPQTDGQTERQNQTLEAYLRAYTNDAGDDWAKILPMAEFAYNNSIHAATGRTPYSVVMTFAPSLPHDVGLRRSESGSTRKRLEPKEVPEARERIRKLDDMKKSMERKLTQVQQYYKTWYNKHHTPQSYAINQWVLLSTKNIRFRSGKTAPKFIGPFRICEIIGNQAYRLDLPPLYQRLHDVFHVSLLEPMSTRPEEGPENYPTPQLEDDDGNQEYEVEAIVDSRTRNRKQEFLVRWKGWPKAYDQWVPLHPDLNNATRLVNDYERTRRERGRTRGAPSLKRKRGANG